MQVQVKPEPELRNHAALSVQNVVGSGDQVEYEIRVQNISTDRTITALQYQTHDFQCPVGAKDTSVCKQPENPDPLLRVIPNLAIGPGESSAFPFFSKYGDDLQHGYFRLVVFETKRLWIDPPPE